jgi:hypothetical protein
LINSNKEKKNFNQYEFSSSPKKPLETIKEEEELKLKKESSTKDLVFSENLLTNGDNDSEKDRINHKNENNINISHFNSNNINKKVENEQKNNKNNFNIEENNKIENNIINNDENQNKIEKNINIDNESKLENIINISSNEEEELNKIVEENNNKVDDLMKSFNINIINDIIDLDVNQFRNKISEFINYCSKEINDIKILNEICNQIKEKIYINYNILIEKQNININEYNIFIQYEQKLDYIILLQNNIINNFKGMNKELSLNINSIKDINNKLNKEISNQEFNDNINIIEQNIKNLENMLQNHFNSDIFDNFNNISIPDINENENFFNELQKIYNPIKEINKAYEHLLIES